MKKINRIEKRMQELQQRGEKALITYITAGLPDMEGTKKLIRAQEEAGVRCCGSWESLSLIPWRTAL